MNKPFSFIGEGVREWQSIDVALSSDSTTFSISAFNGASELGKGDIAVDHIIALNNVITCKYYSYATVISQYIASLLSNMSRGDSCFTRS